MEILRNMLSASRIIRLLILVLGCVAVWKVWDYIGWGRRPGKQQQPMLPQPVLDPNAKMDSIPKLSRSPPEGLNQLEVQNLYRPLIQVFYEPLCPDSKHFIRTQLAPAMEKLSSYVRLDLVPYGKATTIEEGGVLKFQCQHGPNECLANKIHGCALDAVPDQLQQIRVVDCMIADNYKPKEVGQKCVKEHDGLDNWMKVFQCYSANRGDQILKHMGAITNSLDPAVSFIPTITIDGSQVGQRSMLRDLTRELCKRLKKDKPSVCL